MYNIIYADPPWSFKNKNTGGSMNSGANAHYPTMTLEEMKNLNVGDLAYENCLLAMWWVSSQPDEAIDLVKAWGFKLKTMTGFSWNKLTKHGLPAFGMGFYTRQGLENCLFAIKGKASEVVKSHSVRSVHSFPITKHSKKPDEFADLLVELCGNVPRLEMFSRDNKPGWDVFGNECKNSINIK